MCQLISKFIFWSIKLSVTELVSVNPFQSSPVRCYYSFQPNINSWSMMYWKYFWLKHIDSLKFTLKVLNFQCLLLFVLYVICCTNQSLKIIGSINPCNFRLYLDFPSYLNVALFCYFQWLTKNNDFPWFEKYWQEAVFRKITIYRRYLKAKNKGRFHCDLLKTLINRYTCTCASASFSGQTRAHRGLCCIRSLFTRFLFSCPSSGVERLAPSFVEFDSKSTRIFI